MYCLLSKLKALKATLKEWVKESCPDIQKVLANNKSKLHIVQSLLGNIGTNPSLELEERNLLAERSTLRQMESMDMHQRAKEEWTIFGDRCSKFFHSFLKAKRNRTIICEIEDGEGISQSGQQKVAKAFELFFFNQLGIPNNSSLTE